MTRMRTKRHIPERMDRCHERWFDVPSDNKGKWREVCGVSADTPIYLELGCGKGKFCNQTALDNPDVVYIAVERDKSVILAAIEKAHNNELPNLFFINCDVNNIEDMFTEDEVDRIYINFCDPWPKARHAKRRLTYPATLVAMKTFLADGGKIEFKTDNGDLFAYSLGSFVEAGYTLDAVTDDLHASEWAATNIMTEYEKNFSEKGFPIHRLEAFLEK